MKKTPESFINDLRHVTLTKQEAHDMRERLIAYSDLHAVPEALNAQRPAAPVSVFSYLLFSSRSRLFVAGTLALLLLISGTGVSYASENTLPGQILYPVKVALVEPLQGALITSPAAKAEWQNELADRRLTEASTLAAQNKLATSTQVYLAESASKHVALAQQAADVLANSGDQSAALHARSDLEARLSAHADFLALIAPRLAESGNATTTAAVVALLQGVEIDRTQVEMSREATEVALASTTIPHGAAGTFNAEVVVGEGDSASSTQTITPEQRRVLAYVEEQNSNRQTEETTLFRKSATLFRLLPPVASSTNASTTLNVTASSTEATTSPFKELFNRSRDQRESTSTTSSNSEKISVPEEGNQSEKKSQHGFFSLPFSF